MAARLSKGQKVLYELWTKKAAWVNLQNPPHFELYAESPINFHSKITLMCATCQARKGFLFLGKVFSLICFLLTHVMPWYLFCTHIGCFIHTWSTNILVSNASALIKLLVHIRGKESYVTVTTKTPLIFNVLRWTLDGSQTSVYDRTAEPFFQMDP